MKFFRKEFTFFLGISAQISMAHIGPADHTHPGYGKEWYLYSPSNPSLLLNPGFAEWDQTKDNERQKSPKLKKSNLPLGKSKKDIRLLKDDNETINL